MSMPEQDLKGRFIAGNSGNGGRPKGSRNKLGEDFLRALHADFVAHGVEAIEQTRIEKPDAYLKVIASILPKQLEAKGSAFEGVSDDELADLIAAAREALAAHESGVEREEPEAEAGQGARTALGLPSQSYAGFWVTRWSGGAV